MSFAQGNSGAAQSCKQGGYTALVGSGGETFANTGECVNFAARGGTFATGIIIPAGKTTTLAFATSACNALAFGYSASNGANTQLGSKAEACPGGQTTGATTIGPFPTAVILTLYMTDVSCGATFDSNGNHARVVSSPPNYRVDFADGGFDCGLVNAPVDLTDGRHGNLRVEVVIN